MKITVTKASVYKSDFGFKFNVSRTICLGHGDRTLFEPRHEKTGFLHMRKQRHRSASR